MRRWLLLVVLLFVLGAGRTVGASSVQGQETTPLYAGPGSGYGQIGSIEAGESTTLLAERQGWLQLRAKSGQVGWLFGWTGSVRYDEAEVYGQVTIASLNVRAEAVPDGRVIGSLARGAMVRWLEKNGVWSRIQTGGSIEGWVATHALVPVSSTIPTPAYWPRPGASGAEPGPPAAIPDLPPYPTYYPPVGTKRVQVQTTTTAYDGGRDPRWYDPLETVYAGQDLQFLDARAGWVKVVAPSGRNGWIPGTTARFTEGDLLYDTDESRWTIRPIADGPVTTTLRRTAPGILYLEVTSGSEMGTPRFEGQDLVVPTYTGQSESKDLPIMATGSRWLSIAPGAVRLSFDGLPGWEVVERSPQRVLIAIRPHLYGVALEEREDRGVLVFRTGGFIEPRTQLLAPGLIRIYMPGAVLVGESAPAGVISRQTVDGVEADVTSKLPFALQRSDAGFELHLHRPGLAGKVIMLDPGHGGPDGGAYDHAVDMWEKQLNLQVALKLANALTAKGVRVLFTRTTDAAAAPDAVFDQRSPADETKRVDLAYRAWMSRQAKTDLFISIHHNSGADGAAGIETYFTRRMLNGERSEQLAQTIQAALIGAQGLPDRGHREEVFFVTRENNAPANLLELAFLSHPTEGLLVAQEDFQAREVTAILSALERYYAERMGPYGGE